MSHGASTGLRSSGQLCLFVICVTATVNACGGGGTSTSGAGVAVAKVAEWEWRIPGTCEYSGDDMTFTAPGDPLLSIGFDSAGAPTAVGNLSSQSKGFMSIIGHPDVAKPTVTITGRNYAVSGPFFVDIGVAVHGDISISCD